MNNPEALQFLFDHFGIDPESDTAREDFEIILTDWPFGDDEPPTDEQIEDIRRALTYKP